jgi:hypothetical protein
MVFHLLSVPPPEAPAQIIGNGFRQPSTPEQTTLPTSMAARQAESRGARCHVATSSRAETHDVTATRRGRNLTPLLAV